VKGPGFYVSVPVPVNATGVKVTKKEAWRLYLGIGVGLSGILLLILFFSMSHKVQAEKTPAEAPKSSV
jgi:hypothetical protein